LVSSFALTFIAGAALGSYVQTMTGFALGIVVTGVVTLSGTVPIADTADALSIIGVINAMVVLPKMGKHTDWPSLLRIMLALTPGMIAGVVLLDTLSSQHSTLLRLLAGVVVLMGGATLLLQPQPVEKPSGPLSTGMLGAIAGVMSGLFSLPGPPMVYHYYRQPLSLETVRAAYRGAGANRYQHGERAYGPAEHSSRYRLQLARCALPAPIIGYRHPPGGFLHPHRNGGANHFHGASRATGSSPIWRLRR